MTEWIDAKDSLPKQNGRFLCRYVFRGDGMSFYQVLDYYATDLTPHFQHELAGVGLRVTHWMPILEPPKEVERGTD